MRMEKRIPFSFLHDIVIVAWFLETDSVFFAHVLKCCIWK